jgi:rod shape-determining protein MreC
MLKIKRTNSSYIFLAVFILLVFLHSIKILEPLENFLLYLVKPVSEKLYNYGAEFNDSYRSRNNKNDLNSQLENLRKEVARLTVLNSKYLSLEEENIKLRKFSDFDNKNDRQTIAVGVIGRETVAQIGNESQNVIINKGSNDGLRLGLGLINEEGVVVGKIIDLKDATAKICLTTSPGCQLAASIQNQNKTLGIVEGDLGLTIKMSYIPQLEKININDIVISSGLGGDIPRGLVIGRVQAVRNESNEIWQSATIEPLVNMDNLTVLAVVIQ